MLRYSGNNTRSMQRSLSLSKGAVSIQGFTLKVKP